MTRSLQETEQIEQILRSHVFQGSETLSRLLRYLAEKSHDEPGTALKEYRIATEVFGRKGDFDPRSDSSVRVQVARLRSKLLEYALTDGANDQIVVEIPKGAYKLTFSAAHAAAPPTRQNGHAEQNGLDASAAAVRAEAHAAEYETLLEAASQRPQGSWRYVAFLLGGLLVCTLVLLAVVWKSRSTKPVTTVEKSTADPALRTFWGPFLKGSDDRWVVFSNAAFVGRPDAGMRYYRPHVDQPGEMQDHYTGVGEVLSVHELDTVFNALGASLRVKRGALLSMDDAKNKNLIFVGAPVENLTLNDIPTTRFFKFQAVSEGPRQGDVSVLNLHPGSGEAATYLNAPNKPIIDDYAIIARLPGLEHNRQIILAAGTTTIGTQAAVEYICHPDTLNVLIKRLGKDGESRPFEAVLHIKVTRGVPVESEIIALHLDVPENQ